MAGERTSPVPGFSGRNAGSSDGIFGIISELAGNIESGALSIINDKIQIFRLKVFCKYDKLNRKRRA